MFQFKRKQQKWQITINPCFVFLYSQYSCILNLIFCICIFIFSSKMLWKAWQMTRRLGVDQSVFCKPSFSSFAKSAENVNPILYICIFEYFHICIFVCLNICILQTKLFVPSAKSDEKVNPSLSMILSHSLEFHMFDIHCLSFCYCEQFQGKAILPVSNCYALRENIESNLFHEQ